MVTRSLPVLHTDLEWWLGIVNLDTDLTVLKCNALEHLLYGRRVVLLYPVLPFTDSFKAPWSLRPPASFLTMVATTIADRHVMLVAFLRFPQMMIVLLLFLQKQNLATAIYLFGLGTLLNNGGT